MNEFPQKCANKFVVTEKCVINAMNTQTSLKLSRGKCYIKFTFFELIYLMGDYCVNTYCSLLGQI